MSTTESTPRLPVLRSYQGDHLREVALPLGGIGTGTISLGGRGDLRDWEVVNRPAKGFTPPCAFLALSVGDADGATPRVTRALEGALDPPFSGWMGAGFLHFGRRNAGLPRFRSCRFDAAYPFATVHLSDPDVPLIVALEAFNPFVPGDAEASGLPIAVLRVVMTNPTDRRLDATVVMSLESFIGTDGKDGAPAGGRNELRRADGITGIHLTSESVAPIDPRFGTMAIATTATDVTHRTAWASTKGGFGDALLDFWDDLDGDGRLEERENGPETPPVASLAGHVRLDAGETAAHMFVLGWHFPNRLTWNPAPEGEPHEEASPPRSAPESCCGGTTDPPPIPGFVGNHYTTRFTDAWDVITTVVPQLPGLERRTRSFVEAFVAADLPDVIKDAALGTVTALRSQTTFRTADGLLFGFEGCADDVGCCLGSCTHVWNYEPATAHLFGDLARTMRTVELAHATDDNGLMSFRVLLPLEHAQKFKTAAADGQMGCLVKVYREWQLSGDDDFLRTLWPKAKAALAFAWIEGGWDGDQDGVMEGCQHNTMDVEYHGPNPQMQLWYLAALRATEEMARHLDEQSLADRCRAMFERGSAYCDDALFNGEYYEHEVRPPASADAMAPGLGINVYDQARCDDPPHQLGPGCLVDQLVGQVLAHQTGLGYLLAQANVRTATASILRHNWRDDMYGHFNNYRSYALSDESALLMATYPRGGRPRVPFPYSNEVMTGFEYTAAVGMLQEGLVDEALQVITAVRARHDGRRRNPFNEPECGHHYARAMASWGALLAWTGFRWSGVDGEMSFRAAREPTTWWWSNGSAHGTVAQRPTADAVGVDLRVIEGDLPIHRVQPAWGGLGRGRPHRDPVTPNDAICVVLSDQTRLSRSG